MSVCVSFFQIILLNYGLDFFMDIFTSDLYSQISFSGFDAGFLVMLGAVVSLLYGVLFENNISNDSCFASLAVESCNIFLLFTDF